MTWIKVDDGFDSDRRIEEVSLSAAGLFMRSVSYSARHGLDGRIDEKWLRRRVTRRNQREQLVVELIEAGLWRRLADDAYGIVPLLDGDADTLVNHFFKEEVDEKRRKDAEKKRAQRLRRVAAIPDYEESVPEGQPWESPSRHRTGQVREGLGLVGGGPVSTSDGASDPWELQPHERLSPDEREAERRRRAAC